MKTIIYYLICITLVFSACDPMDDILDELNELNKEYVGEATYTLISDDYETIADLALYADSNDVVNTSFIETNEYFCDTVSASKYIPALLSNLFPAFGKNSVATITYNFYDGYPGYLMDYVQAPFYEVASEDYQSVGGSVEEYEFFLPGDEPEDHLPGILISQFPDAVDGDMVLVECKYSPVIPTGPAENILFEDDFEDDDQLLKWTAYSVVGDQVWSHSSYSGNSFVKISGYYDGGNHLNEDWLITPAINLDDTENEIFTFSTMCNYAGPVLEVKYSSDYAGSGDPSTATWTDFTGYSLSEGGFELVESGEIFLDALTGSINIAFVYTSTDAESKTWEVDDVKVKTESDISYNTVYDIYQFNGTTWSPEEDLFVLDSDEYDAMGDPGKYDNFSSSEPPENYLPQYLNAHLPYAQEEDKVAVMYRYYAGTTIWKADEYSVSGGQWTMYKPVIEQSSQFIQNGEKWVFDPTVMFSLVSSDYQIIVDYVNDNVDPEYVDSYGTSESYFGASAFYGNFDIRPGYHEFDPESWEEALKEAIGTALLPVKFPNAVTQVEGVDVYYVATFDTYSGSDGTYSITFQCTKSGPDPEFTYIEGPTPK